MSKKHHMTKLEYNKQKKHRRHIKRRHDTENEAAQANRVSHGRLRERNPMHDAHHIRSINDLEDDFFEPEDDFFDAAVEDDEIRA